jgi:CheY-like chemotaxis protein
MFNNVMLIDDDDITIMICELRLNKSQFSKNVISFLSANAALDYYKYQISLPTVEQVLPELIFLDINMPEKSGWDFLHEFEKDVLPHIQAPKIAILSSTVNPEDTEKASFNPHLTGFINKPLTSDSLTKFKLLINYN